ncbi:asparaginyl-tRNA synthetase, partial [Lecanoromycetidae sp. Uapishka_2]
MVEHSEKVYVDEDVGKDDISADGSETKPYKTLLFAHIQHPPAPSDGPQYFTRRSETGAVSADGDPEARKEWKPITKSAQKKVTNLYDQHKKKLAKTNDLAIREKQEQEKKQIALQEAMKVRIKEDSSLPKATKIHLNEKGPAIKLRKGTHDKDVDYSEGRGTRVRVVGRVHRFRTQKDVMFLVLQDGYGFLQCVLTGDLTKTYDAVTLTQETSMEIYGEMWEVPPKQHAPDDRELHADYYEIIGKAAGDKEAITTVVAQDADSQTLYDKRHLVLRGEVSSSVMKVRAALLRAFRKTYEDVITPSCLEVTPPCMVQTQVEGGSTLFEFSYYNEKAYLTQSSQLYLETCLPSLGNVFCVAPSFRAEKAHTRRHLSEYTHVEAELDFITFNDLLDHLEEVMSKVIQIALSDPKIKKIVYELNPKFTIPERPFMRMKYKDAIKWLIEHDIKNEEGQPHKEGDDIAEAAERQMTDIINKPIFLTHFPVEIKAFYMQKDPEDREVTESVDCLMPGVGEIVGGSMRMNDYDELMAAYKREGIDPAPYYWYTDQRKYGTSPHGGYGLGLERFLAWMCGRYTVRDCCLYPRFTGRCTP